MRSVARIALLGVFLWAGLATVQADPVVIAHRGNSSVAPENTVASINAAAGYAWGTEMDPRVTLDNYSVMMHDSNTLRTTGVSGEVASMTLAEIKALDASYKFPAYAGEQVPTLAESMTAVVNNGLVACLDVKGVTEGNAATYASLYVNRLQTYKSQLEFHCFQQNFLDAVYALDPDFTLVLLGSDPLTTSIISSLPSYVTKLSWSHSGLSPSSIDAAHAAGKQVYAWTVNDVARMNELTTWGVDGIVTDYPHLVGATVPEPKYPSHLQDGLIRNWSFDEGLGDGFATQAAESVKGYHATLGPGVELPDRWLGAGQAKLGGALQFDGVDDMASVPTGPEVMDAVTISTWVKLDQLPGYLPSGFGSIYDSVEDGYVLYVDHGNDELRFKATSVTSGAAARPGIPAALLDTTSWHHVVGVYDGRAGVARIYLDGNLIDMHADDGSGSDGLVGLVKPQIAAIGSEGGSLKNPFAGRIDDMAIWSRAISQAEIQHLYNAGTGRAVAATNPYVASAVPVVRLRFENNLQNAGSGGTAYNGTLNDGPDGSINYVSGPRGLALELTNQVPTNNGDTVSIPYELTDSGTISLWCKPGAYYNYKSVFDNSGNPGDWEMWIYGSGVAQFRIQDDSFVNFDLNQLGGPEDWYHLAVTWFRTGGNVVTNLFVDGQLSDVDEGAWVNPGDTVFLAGGNAGNDDGNVSLDDFRIYDIVLTAEEIAAIWLGREVADMIPGDADFSGTVDAADARILAENWLRSDDVSWGDGDFNDDGVVNDLDASILAAHWQTSHSEAAVPEPGVLVLGLTSLLAVGTLLVCRHWCE
ncbi:MAG: hypothetical protein JW818_00230 [Pirellulales bacterium]|nr:hypothetical protein [Pirellulales bacterium]